MVLHIGSRRSFMVLYTGLHGYHRFYDRCMGYGCFAFMDELKLHGCLRGHKRGAHNPRWT